MHTDPIRPGPKAPQQWVPLFLAQLAISPDLPRAYLSGCTSAEQVETERARSGYFDAAYRIILREHRRRAREAGLPVPPVPAAPQYHLAAQAKPAASVPALSTPADLGALVLLCREIAQAVGVDTFDGLTIPEWFKRERETILVHQVLDAVSANPALVPPLQSLLDAVRNQPLGDFFFQPWQV